MLGAGLPIKTEEAAKRFTRELKIASAKDYIVVDPNGDVMRIKEYLKTKDYRDKLKELSLEPEPESTPVYVGELMEPFGIKGYSKAEVGHPVFELNDKFIITIFNEKNEPHVVSFYKETLSPCIKRKE